MSYTNVDLDIIDDLSVSELRQIAKGIAKDVFADILNKPQLVRILKMRLRALQTKSKTVDYFNKHGKLPNGLCKRVLKNVTTKRASSKIPVVQYHPTQRSSSQRQYKYQLENLKRNSFKKKTTTYRTPKKPCRRAKISPRYVPRRNCENFKFIEPLPTLFKRLKHITKPNADGGILNNKTILGPVKDVWSVETTNGILDDNSLGHEIQHRIVSNSLLPIDCIVTQDPSAQSDYRRRSFSPRPASLRSIINDSQPHNNTVPVLRFVTGDDRHALRRSNAINKHKNLEDERASLIKAAIRLNNKRNEAQRRNRNNTRSYDECRYRPNSRYPSDGDYERRPDFVEDIGYLPNDSMAIVRFK